MAMVKLEKLKSLASEQTFLFKRKMSEIILLSVFCLGPSAFIWGGGGGGGGGA